MRTLVLLGVAVVVVTLVAVQAAFLRVGADIVTSVVIFGLGYGACALRTKD